jgi:hypothetical protein
VGTADIQFFFGFMTRKEPTAVIPTDSPQLQSFKVRNHLINSVEDLLVGPLGLYKILVAEDFKPA